MYKYLTHIIITFLLALASTFSHAENGFSQCQFSEDEIHIENGVVKYFSVGSGKPVLLIHGLFAQKEQWSEFACDLSHDGYLVYALDLPGYGQSTGFSIVDYQLSKEVSLIHQFIEKLGIKRLHIAGSSMGGALAAIYAKQYPREVQSIGFIGAPLGVITWSPQVRGEIYKGINPFIPINIEQFNVEMSLLFAKPPVIADSVKEQLIGVYVANNRHYQQVWDIVNLELNVLIPEKKSSKPTFSVWGAEDGIFNVSGKYLLDRKFPNSQSFVIPNTAHLIMLEKPNEIASLYKKFLRSKRVAN